MRNIKVIGSMALYLFIAVFASCEMSLEEKTEVIMRAQAKIREENDPAAALEILENGIRGADRDAGYYFLHGVCTELRNDLGEKNIPLALEDYLRAYAMRPDIWHINAWTGMAYVELEEYELAIPFLERTFVLPSGEDDAAPLRPYYSLAQAYYHTGRIPEALEMVEKAIGRWNDPLFYMYRGIIRSHDGDTDALSEDYLTARERAAGSISADLDIRRRYALRLMEMGHIEMARGLYEGWLEENAEYLFCYAELGYLHMLEGDWEKSLKMLRAAMKISPGNRLLLEYVSFYCYFTGNLARSFLYGAMARVQTMPDYEILPFRSREEYIEQYRRNWQFQRLLDRWGTGVDLPGVSFDDAFEWRVNP